MAHDQARAPVNLNPEVYQDQGDAKGSAYLRTDDSPGTDDGEAVGAELHGDGARIRARLEARREAAAAARDAECTFKPLLTARAKRMQARTDSGGGGGGASGGGASGGDASGGGARGAVMLACELGEYASDSVAGGKVDAKNDELPSPAAASARSIRAPGAVLPRRLPTRRPSRRASRSASSAAV